MYFFNLNSKQLFSMIIGIGSMYVEKRNLKDYSWDFSHRLQGNKFQTRYVDYVFNYTKRKTYHFLIVRQSNGYVSRIFGFHLENVPGALGFDGRHGGAVLCGKTSSRSSKASFRVIAIIVERISHRGSFQLTKFPLVGTTDKCYVMITNTECCENHEICKIIILHTINVVLIFKWFL